MRSLRARRSAVTIDVDSLACYRAIHGLGAVDDAEDPIYTVALPRFFELVARAGVSPTLFLIGQDAPRWAEVFRPLRDLGAEVASHSFGHDYRLSTRPKAEIRTDLEAAHRALLPLAPDGRIQGFRAPGYNTTAALLEVVTELGYAYDSSVLPSPLYFAARAAAIAGYALRRRPSRSLVGDPRAFLGAFSPRRIAPGRPWAHDPTGSLLELPMACEPLTRAPLIGTTWVLASERVRAWMIDSALQRLDVLNFELHAIDLLDHTDRGVSPELAAAQHDLGVPVAEKMRALGALFARLAAETEVLTLAELAA